MILPIIAYGDPVLRAQTREVEPGYPGLHQLIADMIETMHHAEGVGLAAPQVGVSIRLFVMDASPLLKENDTPRSGAGKVFINPRLLSASGQDWTYNEGCLSLPEIREDVVRKEEVQLGWFDENFRKFQNRFTGIEGRIILHEYDHLEGVLFIDYLSFLKRNLLKGRLNGILRGTVKVKYPMRFPGIKGGKSFFIQR